MQCLQELRTPGFARERLFKEGGQAAIVLPPGPGLQAALTSQPTPPTVSTGLREHVEPQPPSVSTATSSPSYPAQNSIPAGTRQMRRRMEVTPQAEVTAAEVADELQRGRCRNGSEAVGVLQLTPRV